ncbi:hypothetical protein [Micromonospora sp. WMMD975]|uniref:hypothetical protein n=1 Tax=Micromonospora sp. WMMD975 TaxID=3016087 RepID=UPI00249B3716|nr:hypothetical protein [Micromonospora sp. WMMD975]WFE35447.1 hypothetical protein O7613_08730 [Micromonospora sp. WMMD975]
MSGGLASGVLGRAFAWLAFWYTLACVLPVGLLVIVRWPQGGTTPGYSYVNGRSVECTGKFGCPTASVDVGAELYDMIVILAPTLLVAVPLCAYLVRRWQLPALAGFVAAVTGWLLLCLGGWLRLHL